MHDPIIEEIEKLKEKVSLLNFHKNLQIDETRKLSRRVDKIVARLQKWKYRFNSIEEDIQVLYSLISNTDFKLEIMRERGNGKVKCCEEKENT